MQLKESFRQYLQGLTAMETVIGTLDSKNHAYVNLSPSMCPSMMPGWPGYATALIYYTFASAYTLDMFEMQCFWH